MNVRQLLRRAPLVLVGIAVPLVVGMLVYWLLSAFIYVLLALAALAVAGYVLRRRSAR